MEEFVDSLNKEMDSLVDDYTKRRIADLEAKLAESEEEKETLRISQSSTHKTMMQLNDELLKTQKKLAEKDKLLSMYPRIEDMYPLQMIKLSNQDKISFAVEQLNQAKEEIGNNISPIIFQDSYWLGKQTVLDKIDNQIAELKKGVE